VWVHGRSQAAQPVLTRNRMGLVIEHTVLYRRTIATLPVSVWHAVERVLKAYGAPIYYSAEPSGSTSAVYLNHYMFCSSVAVFADLILIPLYNLHYRLPTIIVTRAPGLQSKSWILGVFAPGQCAAFCLGKAEQWPAILHGSDIQDWFKYYYDIEVEFTLVRED
jgi:hypothetical protein